MSKDVNHKCQVITELKAHIKHEFVDLAQVPRYFEALRVGVKSSDSKLSSVSFSSTCHLIKRVGMQDPNALRGPSKIILPILINRLLDPKPVFQQQTRSTLETYWLATPTIVEKYIKDNALIHSNARVRAESIVFVSDLIELNKNFNFQQLLPNVVNMLRDRNIEVVKNAEVLLVKYYTIHKSKVQELADELTSQKIESKKAIKLLRSIDATAAAFFEAEAKTSTSNKPMIDTFSNLSRTQKKTSSTLAPNVRLAKSSSTDFSDILGSVPTAKLDQSISPVVVHSSSSLQKEIEALLPPFQGKETEFNWNNREKNIIKLRGLIIGNSEKYPDASVSGIRLMLDGINKSILSLRTTLSSNGCQLVKEIAFYMNSNIDPIAESLFNPLATLTSATKKISSLNAFGAICVLLANTSFNGRLFNHCYNLFLDKNIQPRLYSSTFFRIFIQRHSGRLDNSQLETLHRWIAKGICDPNTTVRESMRVTFWIFYRFFTEQAQTIITKQDMNVKKALERSRPRDIEPINTTPGSVKQGMPSLERKRPSIKEMIASKKMDRRSVSGPEISESSLNDDTSAASELGKPARLGLPQRVRVSSAGVQYPLERQLSKGRTDEKQKWMTSASRENTVDISKKDSTEGETTIQNMIKLLQSPLTRERVDGIEILIQQFDSTNEIPDLEAVLNNILVLDTQLLKPLLSHDKFFNMAQPSFFIKLLAVYNMGIDDIRLRYGTLETCNAIVSLMNSLESFHFSDAPSTMFHIKYKNLFLDYSVKNLYILLSESDLKLDDIQFEKICSAVFPLSISDYPKYDELVVLLHGFNTSSFEHALDSSNAYVKSKIKMILDDFKEDNEDMAVEHTIPVELTMINPFSSKKTPVQGTAVHDDVPHQNVDYMSDIFNGSKEATNNFTFIGPANAVHRALEQEDKEMVDSSPEPEIPNHLFNDEIHSVGSPFLNDPSEDDHIKPKLETDEQTHTMTVNLNDVHISPEKHIVTPKTFVAPDRKSLTEMISKSDPIFSKTTPRIQIFEDAPNTSVGERKLFDLELSRFQNVKAEDPTVSKLLQLSDLFKDDNIDRNTMNCAIKTLQQSVSNEEVLSWLKHSGFMTLSKSVIHYFHKSMNISAELCFKGLIVIKELLIIDQFLDGLLTLSEAKEIWNIANMVVENLKTFKSPIFISVDELVDDLIDLNIDDFKSEILRNCISQLRESKAVVPASFLLDTLAKCIEFDVITIDQIKEIDNTIFGFLSHDEVEIRRLTIIVYSKCKRTLQQLNSNAQVKDMVKNHHECSEYLFDKLTVPQRKLVDYYCDN